PRLSGLAVPLATRTWALGRRGGRRCFRLGLSYSYSGAIGGGISDRRDSLGRCRGYDRRFRRGRRLLRCLGRLPARARAARPRRRFGSSLRRRRDVLLVSQWSSSLNVIVAETGAEIAPNGHVRGASARCGGCEFGNTTGHGVGGHGRNMRTKEPEQAMIVAHLRQAVSHKDGSPSETRRRQRRTS